jgi:oxaloacetate decarboxylase
MDWSKRRKKFRALVAGKKCVHPASVHDPLTARIAEDLGFECGMYAGSIASETVLAAPDTMVLTLTEFAEQAYRMNRAANLPIVCEVDNAYGNALNARRTVEEMENAGVVAICVEDTLAPRPYGKSTKLGFLSLEESVGKMKASLDARQDKSMIIAGRTRALAVNGLKDAIARCKAYEKAGVDAIFLAGKKSLSDLEEVCGALKVPVFTSGVNANGDLYDIKHLSKIGVRVALQGHLPIQAAVKGIHDTLKALRSGTPPKQLKNMVASKELMDKATRATDYDRWTEAYLGGKRVGH